MKTTLKNRSEERKNMGISREDVMKFAPDLTNDQVTALLNRFHEEVQTVQTTAEEKAKNNAGQAKENEKLVEDLKQKLAETERQKEEAENKNLSEVDLLKKEIGKLKNENSKLESDASKENAELRAQISSLTIGSYASAKGLSGEKIANILNAFGTDVERAKTAIDSLSELKDEWSAAAALAKEQEIAKQSGNPGGNPGGNDTQSIAEAKAKERAARKSGGVNNEVIELYRR